MRRVEFKTYKRILVRSATAKPEGGDELVERDEEVDVRSLWERMNGVPEDLLYAGEYEQYM